MPHDYFIEFHEILEKVIREDMDGFGRKAFCLGTYDLRRPALNYLWYRRLSYRDAYDDLRKSGKEPLEAIKEARLKDLPIPPSDFQRVIPLSQHPWSDALEPFQGRTVFFCVGQRNLEYMRPVIASFNENALIWTDADCSSRTWIGGNKVILPFSLSRLHTFCNTRLEYNFPDFCAFANTILATLSLLKPSKIVCNDGCQTQYMIAAEYCKIARIPSICIQQGWPSILHAGFRDWPYSDFISWGTGFSTLFKAKNGNVNFSAGGYPYDVLQNNSNRRQGIGFFLQDKVFLSSERSFQIMREAIRFSALFYPSSPIYIRRHPLSGNQDGFSFEDLSNVVNADDMPLPLLYSRCKVTVSHFSSCIMESAIHSCVPIVLDPTWKSRYSPDIEKEGIGFICNDIETFKEVLPAAYKEKTKGINRQWCEYTGKDAARNICSRISSRSFVEKIVRHPRR